MLVPDVDQIATKLVDLGLSARMMAPAWKRHAIRQLAVGEHGEFVGWMLPGKGLLLKHLDTDRLGITRELPYVYSYSPFARLRDRWARKVGRFHENEVGAITTYDGIINARANGKARDAAISIASITTVATFWYDTRLATGTGGAGTFDAGTPPTDAKLTRASAGARNIGLPDPGGTDKAYLLTVGMSASSAHNFGLLVDRHLQGGNYTLTAATSTVTTPKTIDRTYGATLGAGNELVATVTTARATPGAGTWAIRYVDENNTSRTSPANALPATADPINRCVAHISIASPFIQQHASSAGMRSVDQGVRAATGDTTGTAALSIVTPLVWIPVLSVANIYVERDLPSDITGVLELANLSQVTGSLELLVYANAASLGTVTGFLRSCQG